MSDQPRHPLTGQFVRRDPLVSSDLGSVTLKGAPRAEPKPDPSWTPPAMPGWSPNAPSGPHNPGGPFWRPF